jgi:hypothetical protein
MRHEARQVPSWLIFDVRQMIPSFAQRAGVFAFWSIVALAAAAAIAFFALPVEARALRRVAAIVCYVCGLPAALGILVLAFEKFGWLKASPRDNSKL